MKKQLSQLSRNFDDHLIGLSLSKIVKFCSIFLSIFNHNWAMQFHCISRRLFKNKNAPYSMIFICRHSYQFNFNLLCVLEITFLHRYCKVWRIFKFQLWIKHFKTYAILLCPPACRFAASWLILISCLTALAKARVTIWAPARMNWTKCFAIF